MLAIRGIYNNGMLRLNGKAPSNNAEVLVIFNTKEVELNGKMTDDEAMRLFHKFTGSIDRDIDFENERDGYLHEKYGPFN
jgi:hypothetical protein